jgi:hypothetical protein
VVAAFVVVVGLAVVVWSGVVVVVRSAVVVVVSIALDVVEAEEVLLLVLPVLVSDSVVSKDALLEEADDEDVVVEELVEKVDATLSKSLGLIVTAGTSRSTSLPFVMASNNGTIVSSASIAVTRPKRKPTWSRSTFAVSKPIVCSASRTSRSEMSSAAPGK